MPAKPDPKPPHSQTPAQAFVPVVDPSKDAGRLRFSDDHETSERVQNAVVDSMERHGYSKASRFAVRLALAEAIVNAFKHGHKGLPPATPIGFEYVVDDATVRVSVEDQGPGFRPEDIPDPTLDENIEKASGRGLMLIRAYMTRVSHSAKGNRLDLIYEKPKG
jgi:serine/threonine-protein kinase RsbW